MILNKQNTERQILSNEIILIVSDRFYNKKKCMGVGTITKKY